jgi:glycerol kinase
MNADLGLKLVSLKVGGDMTGNELLMQFQADLLGVPVIRPKISQTTALGVAYAAGLAVDFWTDLDEIRQYWTLDKIWEPDLNSKAHDTLYQEWKKAVTRTFKWVDEV